MEINQIQNYNPKTRFTKKGNVYEKTNTGKIVGSAVFASIGAINTVKNLNVIKDATKNYFPEVKIEPYIAIASAIFIGLSTLPGLGLGAIADGIINKVRANKADKANNVNLNA